MPARDVPEKFLVAFSFAEEERMLVRAIAEAVEARLGRSNVFLDEWYRHYIAGDGADKKLQKICREGCVLAVVCVSGSYGAKVWTLAEQDGIRERVNRARAPSASEKERLAVLPIRVGDGDVEGISSYTWIVPDVRDNALDQTADLIVGRLGLVAPEMHHAWQSPARPPWPNEPTPFNHELCDRDEWSAIQRLMTANATKRILMFKGPSGFSKSALLAAAAGYANILGVPFAYEDFKDVQLLSQTGFLKSLRLDLGTLLPGFAVAQEPDPWTLLEALRRLSGPVLIVLDSYDKITAIKELVDWIEIKLLAEVEHCKQIRFLVGGKEVPERIHYRWRDLAEEIELNEINDPQAWAEWMRRMYPHVDFNQFEGLVRGLKGVPATISTILTTCAQNLLRTT